jgi:hypothetical protein
MEIQISSLVLILTGCLVGSRSIAARSLAFPGDAPLRRDIMSMGASAVSPHFPQQREASRGGNRPPRSLFSNTLRGGAGREPVRGWRSLPPGKA